MLSEIGKALSNPAVLLVPIAFPTLFIWLLNFQKKISLNWKEAFVIYLVHATFLMAAVAKLMALIESAWNAGEAANYRLYGAVFFLPIVYYIWAKATKRDIRLVFDVFAIYLVLDMIFARANCFLLGCCEGTYISESLAVRWPLREIEIVYYLIFAFIFAPKVKNGRTHGEIYPLYMITYGILRLIIEGFREEYTGQIGMLHMAHIWSLLSITIGGFLYLRIKNRGIKND